MLVSHAPKARHLRLKHYSFLEVPKSIIRVFSSYRSIKTHTVLMLIKYLLLIIIDLISLYIIYNYIFAFFQAYCVIVFYLKGLLNLKIYC